MKELVRANFGSGYRYLLGLVFTVGVLLALGIGLLLDEPRVRAQDTISPEHNCDVRQLRLGDTVVERHLGRGLPLSDDST